MAYEYITVGALKTALNGQIDGSDTRLNARLRQVIQEASAWLNDHTGRVFTAQAAVTRYFDAPADPILIVPDLVTVTSLTVGGLALTAGTSYELLPYQQVDPAQPGSRIVRRLINGYPARWDTSDPAWGRSPRKQIVIVGSWGYASVPPLITRLTRKVAVRMWAEELAGYSGGVGNAQQGQAATSAYLDERDLLDLAAYKILTYGAGTLSMQHEPAWKVLTP